MSNESITIFENNTYHLRSINKDDIELLRKWKNKNKKYFFHSSPISFEQQLMWFRSFLGREYDHMYLVEEFCDKKPRRVGTMGWRIKDEHADIYNIMRGAESHCEGYSMGDALRLMISYIIQEELVLVRCIVLKNNPAVNWYLKNGMKIINEDAKSFGLEYYDNHNLKNYRIVDSL